MPGLLNSASTQINGLDYTIRPAPTSNDDANGEHNVDGPESSIVELTQEEFPDHFIERDGRLYHSSPSPYPLPVDTPEQERLTALHEVLRWYHGHNYVGPVSEVLANSDQRRKMALDVGTGNGIWVIEMAAEYPHVYFIGFDHVPIATRYPPDNAQFEIHDISARYRWPDENFDLIHARAICMAVRDYRAALGEMARVLRPGGLFISSEWGHNISFAPSSTRNLATHAPASCRFHDAVNNALHSCQGLSPISARIPSFLASGGKFAQISSRTYYIPIGAWSSSSNSQNIGEMNLWAQERYAESVKFLLVQAGWAESDISDLVYDYIEEIRSVQGLFTILYTTHARKT